jgi:hemoglobin-like flavoprotein
MTPESQRLVRESFSKVAPISSTAASLFYDRLFTLDPTLRPLFKGDMQEQGRKLMTMIGTAVANLHRLDNIVPAVRDLGQRHAGYGVTAAHYDTVAAALLWTLEQGLGDDFTPQTRQAWIECYTILAGTMQQPAAAS